jgi:ectoine hydroxylase-related dioxygenase (phytanoyl-CoA dioxygenase family)
MMHSTVHSDEAVRERLRSDGFAMIESLCCPATVAELCQAMGGELTADSQRVRGGSTYALRNVLSLVPRVRELVRSAEVRGLVDPLLGERVAAVRAILFDKTPDANWKVAWHQDLSIAVKERVEAAGYGPWSVKAGVTHVQPPIQILEEMVTLRIHLDDCDEMNGPLRVIPGSHAEGALDSKRVEELARTRAQVACTGRAGGAVLMSPLILHASSSATTPGRRRVLHVEFAGGDLPGGVEWHERLGVC